MHMMSKVLSDGQSSRIYRKLVYETGLALTAFGGGNFIEHPNLFFAVAIVNPGQSPDDVEKALIAELDRLKTEGITERELQRAKNQFARDYILGRDVDPGEGDAPRARRGDSRRHHVRRRRVRHLPEVSLADVQRVAQTYFVPEGRVVLHVMPQGRWTR